MKNQISAVIFGLAIVLAAYFLASAYAGRMSSDGSIQVTGLGKTDFVSDLIVWSADFSATAYDLSDAYAALQDKQSIVERYLSERGLSDEELVFSAVSTSTRSKRLYNSEGNYVGEEFTGYNLSQSVTIESKKVAEIEKISREITELLNQGVTMYSESPRYYYTQLADLKIQMISEATEDARIRAETIAEEAGSRLGALQSARMGVFQITGQNSAEDYSWGGTFNTSSKNKTASITMKLVYDVK
jgi:hypothetical protein